MIPYGITRGPYMFQKVIDLRLLGLDNAPAAVFQDGIIGGGENKDDHLKSFSIVLQQ